MSGISSKPWLRTDNAYYAAMHGICRWGGEDLNIGKNIPRVYFEDIILVHMCIV